MAEYQVKNGSHVAKAFKVRGGHTVVPAGKEVNILDAKELTGAQIDAFARERVKVSAKVKTTAKKDDAGDAKSAADVLAMADGNFMAFKSAASKLLGDATPSKKDEIVAALEELATNPE